MQSIVIVGSGLAGYSVAREVRKRDKTARLVVVSADDGHFYSKPALSEAFRLGAPVAELSSRSAEAMAAQIKGEVWSDTRVTQLDLADHVLETSRGRLGYDRLVLALGAEPVRLPLDAASLARVLSVNDLCDYRRFRAAARGRKVVAILGAGLIGCEFANDLVHAGFAVKVIDIAGLPLNRLLPAANARCMHDALQRAGVDWHLGTGVERIEAKGEGVRILCTNGDAFDADLVLSAIGLRPRTALARAAGLAVAHGISVDAGLRTSDPQVYALGDCAQVDGLWLPYIAPIGAAAKVVAANLAGEAATVRYAPMPVVVKTPACPSVVCPPPIDVSGEWHTESDASGVQSLFRDEAGQLRGFALNGARTECAGALAQAMPMWLA
ncbi:NAD(P)/FAD-dependent oxidoreductase [Variovorax sp. M-6]|uniref:NAD(P)/FAD-dependent oxidoreductase n=1 Tax=Variovorax sp. M-6 TaxID=3233041 RepID=UPI003F9CC0B7